MTRRSLLALLTILTFILPGVAFAQVASAPLRMRAEQVMTMLRGGEADPATMFTSEFLAQVPPAQLRTVIEQLRTSYGTFRTLERIEVQTAFSGTLHVEAERATVQIVLGVQPDAPNRIHTLLVTGAATRGDTLDAVTSELRALPGQIGFAVVRLNHGGPAMIASIEPDRALAVGSAFKLFILAELSRQVGAGQRRWGDVVPLDRPPQPGGTLANWPTGAPMTIHSLAALMIGQSDNRATDVLLGVAGRENVERMMGTIGVAAAARNRPLLGTRELFAVKSADAAALNAWLSADEAARRQMLATRFADPRPDPSRFTGAPLRIDSVEWFASPADLARTMDWLRREGDDTARAILAINPGTGPAARGDLAYVGYKGGSEPGVLNLTWLVRNRAGAWHVVTGSWNNPAAALDEGRFGALMARALQLVR